MTTWFGKHKDGFSNFNVVDTALKHRRQYFIDHRNLKLEFIHRIGLNWSPATRDLCLKGVKTVSLQKLRTPYPPMKNWICESATINDKWSDYLKFNPRAQPDRHHKRQPIFHIHPSHLLLNIGADQSVVVYDAATGQLILIVLQNFCSNPHLLSHIEGIIKQAVECCKTIRVSHFN